MSSDEGQWDESPFNVTTIFFVLSRRSFKERGEKMQMGCRRFQRGLPLFAVIMGVASPPQNRRAAKCTRRMQSSRLRSVSLRFDSAKGNKSSLLFSFFFIRARITDFRHGPLPDCLGFLPYDLAV